LKGNDELNGLIVLVGGLELVIL